MIHRLTIRLEKLGLFKHIALKMAKTEQIKMVMCDKRFCCQNL